MIGWVVAVFIALWVVGNIIGWALIREKFHVGGRPWTWRVLAGPFAYQRWLTRRGVQ